MGSTSSSIMKTTTILTILAVLISVASSAPANAPATKTTPGAPESKPDKYTIHNKNKHGVGFFDRSTGEAILHQYLIGSICNGADLTCRSLTTGKLDYNQGSKSKY